MTAAERDHTRDGADEAAGEAALSIEAQLEALLFVAEGGAELRDLARALGVGVEVARRTLDGLTASLRERGLRVQWHDGRAQLVSAPAAAAVVQRFLGLEPETKLSTAAMETLAILAWRQPITRPRIEAIRGVDCGRALATLKARGLIEEVGRAETAGRPLLYGTTLRFLEHFGLERASDLPPLPAEVEAAISERSLGGLV